MKKVIIFLSIVVFFSTNGLTQTKNVNVDNLGFLASWRNLPENPLNPVYFTYAVKINGTVAKSGAISAEELANLASIAGQVKVNNPSEANVVLELTFGSLIITENRVDERKEEKKDKKTGAVTTTYYYKAVVKYTFESSYLIKKGQTVLQSKSVYSASSPFSYQSTEYDNRKAAYDFWNDNKSALIAQFYRELATKTANALTETASRLYGFPAVTKSYDIIKTINEKKHDENEAFRAASSTLKDALTAMTPDIPMNREKVDGLIDYFKSIPQRYADPDSKADTRLRYAAWYNLCKIYLYLDEPEKVEEFALLLANNDYDRKDGPKMIKEAEELRAVFEKTGIHTRHFIPEEYFSQK